MKISVVIPAYNEEKYIGRTLESVKNLDLGEHKLEVLVLDPGSTDRTKDVAKKYGAKVIKIEHKTIGSARKQGILHASGDIIFSTDADTLLPRNWITKHSAILEKPGVACSCGGFRFIDGQFPLFHYSNYILPILLWLTYKLFNVVIATSQNIAFWRKKALIIGGFDENIGVLEDVDFAVRMRKTGKVIFDPNLVIRCSGRRSKEGWKYFIRSSIAIFRYFILGRTNLGGFPDYR